MLSMASFVKLFDVLLHAIHIFVFHILSMGMPIDIIDSMYKIKKKN